MRKAQKESPSLHKPTYPGEPDWPYETHLFIVGMVVVILVVLTR